MADLAREGVGLAARAIQRDRELTREDLTTLHASDIRASRVFGGSDT